jgi:hypothetical protein
MRLNFAIAFDSDLNCRMNEYMPLSRSSIVCLLQHLRRAFLRHYDDIVLVGNDDVVQTDGHARALDGNVPGHRRIVANRHGHDAMEKFGSSSDRMSTWRLASLLKDADGLDRVRLFDQTRMPAQSRGEDQRVLCALSEHAIRLQECPDRHRIAAGTTARGWSTLTHGTPSASCPITGLTFDSTPESA